MMQRYLACLLAATTALSGCSGGTIFKQTTLGSASVLSIDARQRVVIEGTRKDNQHVVCAEPSPDSIVASAAELAASGSAPIGNTTVNAKLAAAYSETAATIGVRTETIQVLRDGYYRICEAYLNGAIERDEYKATLGFIDEFIVTVVAIETLGGKVMAPAVIISPQGRVTAGDSPDANNPGGTNSLTKIEVSAAGLDAEAAAAIATILHHYYIRKNQYQNYLLRLPRH